MPDEKLTLTTELRDGAQTAAGLNEVAEAEAKVATGTKAAGQAAGEAAEKAAKLSAAQSDYTGILRQIHPALGELADGLINATRIAGDLGQQNVSLQGVFESLQSAVVKNANALKLLGAGGAVAVGIYAIVGAVRQMREEFEAATKAIREQTEAATELAQKQAELQQRIEDASDARRGGGFSADESREALARVQRIRERSPFIEEAAAIKAVTGPGGLSESIERLERIAFGLQSGVTSPEAAERAFQRERQQQAEQAAAARRQAASAIGSTADLQAIAAQFTKGTAQDPALIASIVQAMIDARSQDRGILKLFDPRSDVEFALAQRGLDIAPRSEQLDLASRVLQFLEGPAKQMEEAARQMSDAAQRLSNGATTVVNDFRGSRVVAPSRAPVRLRNGERALDAVRR